MDDSTNIHRVENSGQYESRSNADGNSSMESDDENENDRIQGRRVYVGNLSWKVKWQELKDHMRAAGDVEHAIILEAGGRSKGCGIVTYASVEDAQNAIDTLNETELDGRKIFVREEHTPISSRGKGCRVYVGNLPWTVKWQDLKDHMKQAGLVVHADVLEESGGRSRGCGLVEYSTPEEAQEAINMLNETELDGRMIFVREDREPDSGSISSIAKRVASRFTGRYNGGRTSGGRSGGRGASYDDNHDASTSGCRQLYVGNLPWDATWESIAPFFDKANNLQSIQVAEYPDGRSRGFAILRFADSKDAQHAISYYNGSNYNGRVLEVRWDKRA